MAAYYNETTRKSRRVSFAQAARVQPEATGALAAFQVAHIKAALDDMKKKAV